MTGVHQGSVLGPQLLFSYTFIILDSKFVGYADDSTLLDVFPSPGVSVDVAEFPPPGVSVDVAESFNCDLNTLVIGMTFVE